MKPGIKATNIILSTVYCNVLYRIMQCSVRVRVLVLVSGVVCLVLHRLAKASELTAL